MELKFASSTGFDGTTIKWLKEEAERLQARRNVLYNGAGTLAPRSPNEEAAMHEQFDGLVNILTYDGVECLFPRHPEWWREARAWAKKFGIPTEHLLAMYATKEGSKK